MRRKRGESPSEESPVIDISSFIDVCFLLLIYFVVTSIIAEEESDLMLKLPYPRPDGKSHEIDPAFFHITEDGSINRIENHESPKSVVGVGYVDCRHRKSTDSIMEQLDREIESYVGIAGDKAVVKVKVDAAAKVQHAVDLFNILSKHGVEKITLVKDM